MPKTIFYCIRNLIILYKSYNHGQEAIPIVKNEKLSLQDIDNDALQQLKNEMLQTLRQEIMQNLEQQNNGQASSFRNN